MSYSSLYVMDNKFNGDVLNDYKNSWLLSPMIWDILFYKYLPEKVKYIAGEKSGLMVSARNDNQLWIELNDKLNESSNLKDRMCWEFSNQQIFMSKDKKLICDALSTFWEDNIQYEDREIGTHIHERFRDVGLDINNIDETEYPYIIFKNTSVDDAIETLFRQYDDNDEIKEISLSEHEKVVAEFVLINDGVMSFCNNVEFCKNNATE